MDWLGHFFDPSDNGFDLVDAGQIMVVIGLVYGAIRVVRRLIVGFLGHRADLMEQRILDALAVSTAAIQPDANGGKSLADLHKKVDGFTDYQRQVNDAREQSIELLIARQSEIADQLFRHIANHGDEGVGQ